MKAPFEGSGLDLWLGFMLQGIAWMVLGWVLCTACHAQEFIGTPSYAPTKLWKVSAVALVAGVGLDVASSLTTGGCEATRLYRSSDGCSFGARGVVIRLGMVAGTLALQRYVIAHVPARHPIHRVFAAVNFTGGAIGAGAAGHNWRNY